MFDLESYGAGRWTRAGGEARPLHSAVTGDVIGSIATEAPDVQAMLDHAGRSGGPALRELGFHDRARMVKALALALRERREELYELSHLTGATHADAKVDVDGGIGTMLVFASKGRRELPDAKVAPDGDLEMLSRDGSFVGQHILTPRLGVGIQINAFNFPVWGMLEKLAPTILAGMPAIVKPASDTAFVTEACIRVILETGILPEGTLQLICGPVGDLLERLGPQDVVSFTGSEATARRLRATPALLERGVPFIAEQDSLNGTVLGPDVEPGSALWARFVNEVITEMTVKAGQKCTAIRRIIVPDHRLRDVSGALTARLAAVRLGDPADPETQMGALASIAQRDDVLARAGLLERAATRLCGNPLRFDVHGADREKGAFLPPTLYRCDDPDGSDIVHEVEAFGPVATLMPCRDTGHAAALLNRGGGSLVGSAFTDDPKVATDLVMDAAAWHGRLYVNGTASAAASTGHGAPVPHMIHGGPGRAGGGEELGGTRAVKHYMHRTAVQGSPQTVAAILGTWVPGAPTTTSPTHPFRRSFDDLQPGDTIEAGPREITLNDVEHFARFTGDTFYAHMDEDAAAANPFFPGRVAHGYLLLSFAAGLFVDPAPGPVLANTGIEKLSFQKPFRPGDSLSVRLTVQRKTRRTETYGEVRWTVVLRDQEGDQVAEYTLLTMNAYAPIEEG